MTKSFIFPLALSAILAAPPVCAVAQTNTAAAPEVVQFKDVAGKTCRGFYDQHVGGKGYLERPAAAFKFKPDVDGKFTFTAKAFSSASTSWKKASGNDYLNQGESNFQLDGKNWKFENTAAHTYYTLSFDRPVQGDVVPFQVLYSDGKATAKGNGECRKD